MPFKLRKAPKRELYWVVNKETGKKFSKDPLPKETALAQMRALYANESKEGGRRKGAVAVGSMTAAATPPPPPPPPRGLIGREHYGNLSKRKLFTELQKVLERIETLLGFRQDVIAYMSEADWIGSSGELELEQMVERALQLHVALTNPIRGGVTISKPDFIKEHENLLRILKSGKRSELVKEAADQREELNKVLKGGLISKDNLQQMAQSAYPGNTRLQIGPYKLQFSTPTLKFYRDGKNIVVSVRGTQPTNAEDLQADAFAIVGRLRSSARYKRDLQTLLEFQTKYPKSEYHYIGVAHSLGAAIMDGFIRAGLLKNGLSYNGLVEPQEIVGNPRHYRIYHKEDPLYLAIGKYVPNVEVRTTNEPFLKTLLKHSLPFGLSTLFNMYDKHMLGTFKGGASAEA